MPLLDLNTKGFLYGLIGALVGSFIIGVGTAIGPALLDAASIAATATATGLYCLFIVYYYLITNIYMYLAGAEAAESLAARLLIPLMPEANPFPSAISQAILRGGFSAAAGAGKRGSVRSVGAEYVSFDPLIEKLVALNHDVQDLFDLTTSLGIAFCCVVCFFFFCCFFMFF